MEHKKATNKNSGKIRKATGKQYPNHWKTEGQLPKIHQTTIPNIPPK